MKNKSKIVEQLNYLKKNAVEIVSEKELAKKIEHALATNTPLKVKAGFDPTASDIHLGHAVLLKKLRAFQDLGHIVYFIVGDFTARIGDPSQRDQLRPVLSDNQIRANAKTYTEQAFKILDKKKTKIVFNSQWFDAMKMKDFAPIFRNYTVARVLERDDFTNRMKKNKPITVLEFIYPLMQAYDSVKIKADVELGGTDQKFNLIVGRHLQSSFGQEPQVLVILPLLTGLDGKDKMSKSLGNYIGVTEDASQIFGKTMSISDELMYHYYQTLTDKNIAEVKKIHPKEAKLQLAALFVSWFYNKKKAVQERQRFKEIFTKKDLTSQKFKEYKLGSSGKAIIDVLMDSHTIASRNEARRLLRQAALEFEGEKIRDEKFTIQRQGILRIGKKKFLKIVTP